METIGPVEFSLPLSNGSVQLSSSICGAGGVWGEVGLNITTKEHEDRSGVFRDVKAMNCFTTANKILCCYPWSCARVSCQEEFVK